MGNLGVQNVMVVEISSSDHMTQAKGGSEHAEVRFAYGKKAHLSTRLCFASAVNLFLVMKKSQLYVTDNPGYNGPPYDVSTRGLVITYLL